VSKIRNTCKHAAILFANTVLHACMHKQRILSLQKHLSEDQWTKEATDHLFDLCR